MFIPLEWIVHINKSNDMKTSILKIISILIVLIIVYSCTKDDEPKPAELTLSVSTLDFGTDNTQLSFTISNPGEEPLEWSLETDLVWITMNPTSGSVIELDANITVSVDRTGRVPSEYSGSITVKTNAGDQTITVSMEIKYDIDKIAFSSDRATGDFDIFIMNVDGSAQQQLTSNAGDNEFPCWSPDGEYITFSSDRFSDYGYDIFKMKSDGSQAIQLTSGKVDFNPSWSPDGTKISFTREMDDGGEIFVMNADGSNQIQLTSDQHDNYLPSVSINNKVVFVSTRDGDEEIFIMNPDGSNQQQLTNNELYDFNPCCSRTSGKIAFTREDEDDVEIFVMNEDGTSQQQLTNNNYVDFQPNW